MRRYDRHRPVLRRPVEPGHYRTVSIDGLDVFYREAGPKHAPTILLLHLPRMPGHGDGARAKNGPALAGHGAGAVRDAVTRMIGTLPEQLRRSLA